MDDFDEFTHLFQVGLLSVAQMNRAIDGLEETDGRRRIPRRLTYGEFNLDNLSDEEVVLRFRFHREHLRTLIEVLTIPEEIRNPDHRYRIPGMTALCVLLRRLAYPNRLSDLECIFGMSGPALSACARFMTNFLLETKGHLLENLDHLRWLNHERLEYYAQAIAGKGAALQNCWGFIDGTARQMCRPSVGQENYFSGHKRYHCLKYQSVLTPDGLIVNLQGAFPGRRHDAGIWREVGMNAQLRRLCTTPMQKYVLYGDPAYPVSDVLIAPYPSTRRDAVSIAFNASMTPVRQAVEWGFGKVVREFAFVDFSKNQKLLLQDLQGMYKVAVLLSNCHTCLYGSQVGDYFHTVPPPLEVYLT